MESNDTLELLSRGHVHVLSTSHQPHHARHRTLVGDHCALPVSPPSTLLILRDDEVGEHEDGSAGSGNGC